MDCLVDFQSLLKSYPASNKVATDLRIQKWLPLYPSPELAGLVADLMGDGHLQGFGKWRFDFCSNSLAELARFENVLFNLFGVKGKIRDCKSNNYGAMNYGVNCRPLAKTLYLVGVPFGNKVLQSYQIPSWITGDKKRFAFFARRYFDCEGCVDLSRPELVISMGKSVDLMPDCVSFLTQIKRGLWDHFGITAKGPYLMSQKIKRKHGAIVQMAKLKINGKSNLVAFHDNIGFDTPGKMAKLAIAIS